MPQSLVSYCDGELYISQKHIKESAIHLFDNEKDFSFSNLENIIADEATRIKIEKDIQKAEMRKRKEEKEIFFGPLPNIKYDKILILYNLDNI